MAGPGGKEIGRVSVRVLPDTSRFGLDVEKYLKRVERTLKVSIPTTLDTTGIKADLGKLAAELRAFEAKNKLTIKTSLDSGGVTKAVTAAHAKATAEAAKKPVQVKLAPATDDFFKQLRTKTRPLEKTVLANLPVGVDGEKLLRRYQSLKKTLERQTSVKIPTELDAAADVRARAQATFAKIKKLAESVKPAVVTVTARADSDAFIKNLKAEAEKLAVGAGINLPASVDGEKTRRDLQALLNKLRTTTNLPLPVTVKETVTMRRDVANIVEDIRGLVARNAPSVPVKTRLAVEESQILADLVALGQKVARKTQFKVAAVPDGRETHADLERLVGELERTSKIAVPTTAEASRDLESSTRGIVDEIQKIAAKVDPPKVKVITRLAVDDNQFLKDLETLGNRVAKQTRLKVRGTPDEAQIRKDIDDLTARLHKEVHVAIPATVEKSQDLEKRAQGIVAEIERIWSRVSAPTVKLPLAADTDKFVKDLVVKGRALAHQADVQLPVTADGRFARVQINRLARLLEKETNVKLPVDVVERHGLRSRAESILREMEGVFSRAIHVNVETRVDRDRLRESLSGINRAIRGVASGFGGIFDKLGGLGKLEELGTQLVLILSRAVAYTTLLGPLILVAAAGVQALAPAFATALPLLGTLVAGVGVFALAWDRLFGQKAAGGKRVGGVFEPIVAEVKKLKESVGDLVVAGLDPLIARLKATSFPVFANGMKQVASAANAAMKEFIGFLTTPAATTAIRTLLGGAAESLTGLGHAFTAFTSGLLTLSAASLPAMKLVVSGIAEAADRFNNFLTRAAASGKLQQVITSAVQDTGSFLSGVGRIALQLGSLLATLRPVAEVTFGVLGNLLSGAIVRLDRFFQSFTLDPAFIATMQNLGGLVTGTIASIFHIIDPLLQSTALHDFITALVTTFNDLIPVVSEVGTAMSNFAAQLLQLAVLPALTALTGLLNALNPLITAVGNSSTAVDLLAAALTVRLIPALLATKVGAAVAGVFQVLATAIVGFANAIPFAVVQMRAFGAEVVAATALSSAASGAAKFGASLRTLAVAALTPATVALAGLGAAIFVYMKGMGNIDAATDKARASFSTLVDSVDAFDSQKVGELTSQLDSTMITGANLAQQYTGFFGTFRAGIDALTNGPLTQAAGQFTAAQEAQIKLNEKVANSTINLSDVARKTGVAYRKLADFVRSHDVDLSKPFSDPDSERARQQVISDIDLIKTQTGLSMSAVEAAVGGGIEEWRKYAAAVDDVVKKSSQAFANDTNFFNVFSPSQLESANKKLAKSQDSLNKKSQKYLDLQEQINVKPAKTALQQVKNSQRLTKALDGIAEAQTNVNKAQAAVNGASLVAQYRGMIQTAKDFVKNLKTAAEKGVNTDFLVQAMIAGPQKAGPILAQIVGDSTGALIKMVNDGARVLTKLQQQMLEKSRIIALAAQANSKSFTDNVGTALRISDLQDQIKGLTVQQAAKILHIPERAARQIGHMFGLQLKEAAQKTLNGNHVKPVVDTPKTLDDLLHGTFHPKIEPTLSMPEAFFNLVNGVFHPKVVPSVVLPKPGDPNFIGPVAPKKHAAAGGLITGPGTYTSDSIPARLSHMEYVQPAHTVLHYGVEVMEALRSHRIPKQVLLAMVNGRAARATATPIAASAPQRVRAVPVLTEAGSASSAPAAQGHPRTLTIVDHDGVFRGQMRVATIKSHRQRAQAERLRRLGTWG